MTTLINSALSPTLLQDVNRALLMLGIPPVRSLAKVPMMTDAGLVLNHYITTVRSVGTRGWYFNTDRRVAVNSTGGVITIDDATAVVRSRPRPGEEELPEVRLVITEGTAGGTLWNLEDDNGTFDDTVDYLVDIIRQVDLDAAPVLFRDYCVYRTVGELAPVFGVGVDKSREERALFDLERTDADNMEAVNLLNTDSYVVDTWYR